jgi:hypothetical protein
MKQIRLKIILFFLCCFIFSFCKKEEQPEVGKVNTTIIPPKDSTKIVDTTHQVIHTLIPYGTYQVVDFLNATPSTLPFNIRIEPNTTGGIYLIRNLDTINYPTLYSSSSNSLRFQKLGYCMFYDYNFANFSYTNSGEIRCDITTKWCHDGGPGGFSDVYHYIGEKL